MPFYKHYAPMERGDAHDLEVLGSHKILCRSTAIPKEPNFIHEATRRSMNDRNVILYITSCSFVGVFSKIVSTKTNSDSSSRRDDYELQKPEHLIATKHCLYEIRFSYDGIGDRIAGGRAKFEQYIPSIAAPGAGPPYQLHSSRNPPQFPSPPPLA